VVVNQTETPDRSILLRQLNFRRIEKWPRSGVTLFNRRRSPSGKFLLGLCIRRGLIPDPNLKYAPQAALLGIAISEKYLHVNTIDLNLADYFCEKF
jgi:hypothetical protein